jgi:hypothetical protein
MTTRQQLVKEATSRLLLHNVKAKLDRPGYKKITPRTAAMIDLVEGVAREMGGKVWEYYLGISDFAYFRLEREVYRNA